MFPREGRNSGDGKHERSTGDLYRCLKCVLLCFLSSEAFSSAHLLCTACHTLWYLSTPWPSAHPAGSRLHTVPWKDAGLCAHCWQPETRTQRAQPPSHAQVMTRASTLEPALWVTALLTHSVHRALRLLVTQNLYNKYINLNHLLWVNHSSLEPDSTDVCKMALLEAIYFCIKENNVDWSHKKNYKT